MSRSIQVQFLCASPKYPHLHGFIDATSIRLQGYERVALTLEMVTVPSSRGCRITSRTSRLNSGNSSRKRTPLCESDYSPGFGTEPPPDNPIGEMVWCGFLKGLVVINGIPAGNVPAIECIFVTSNASSKVISGKIVPILCACIVYAVPGEPIRRIL